MENKEMEMKLFHHSIAQSKIMAQLLYEESKFSSSILDWTMDEYWGMVVRDNLHCFDESWQLLNDNGYNTSKNPHYQCDDDYAVWIEPVNSIDKYYKTKVIISSSSSICADDNTIIFVKDESELKPDKPKLRIVSVWPKQKKDKNGYMIHPSLLTYRKHGFKYGYGDLRDIGHILTYGGIIAPYRVERACSTIPKIKRALRDLSFHHSTLVNEFGNFPEK